MAKPLAWQTMAPFGPSRFILDPFSQQRIATLDVSGVPCTNGLGSLGGAGIELRQFEVIWAGIDGAYLPRIW